MKLRLRGLHDLTRAPVVERPHLFIRFVFRAQRGTRRPVNLRLN